jgi:hypothetical protein
MSVAAAAAFLAWAPLPGNAQDKTAEEIEKYRRALAEGNPAELWEVRGEALWVAKRGPNNVSLEKCDLGLGRRGRRAVPVFRHTDRCGTRNRAWFLHGDAAGSEGHEENPFSAPGRPPS